MAGEYGPCEGKCKAATAEDQAAQPDEIMCQKKRRTGHSDGPQISFDAEAMHVNECVVKQYRSEEDNCRIHMGRECVDITGRQSCGPAAGLGPSDHKPSRRCRPDKASIITSGYLTALNISGAS